MELFAIVNSDGEFSEVYCSFIVKLLVLAEFEEIKSERVKSFLHDPLAVTFQSLTVDDLKQLVQYWGGGETQGLK